MRKKRTPANDPVISHEIMEKARQSIETDKLKKTIKCVVCGSECASNSPENLCWVCRRLKISAWHESEQQMPAQE